MPYLEFTMSLFPLEAVKMGKPTQDSCKGCGQLMYNLHFPSGHQKLFCGLIARHLNGLRKCPRDRLYLSPKKHQLKKAIIDTYHVDGDKAKEIIQSFDRLNSLLKETSE